MPSEETKRAREAGWKLIVFGASLLAVGLVFLVIVERQTGGAVTHAEIDRRGPSVPLLAGLPATIGYMLCVVGTYRAATGRGPGHERKDPLAIVARAVFGVLVVALFFAGAFVITIRLRG